MSTDHFVALGQPRRPWLEPESLKEVFHRLTAEHHPDRTGEARLFTEINAAYAVLRDPVARLRHLLELERPAAEPAEAPLPEELTETFMRVATLRRTIDAFVKQQSAAVTPLARALMASARFSLERDVELEIETLESALAIGFEAVRVANVQWPERSEKLFAQLASLQQELTYLAKWTGQLREALFQLQSPV